MNRSPIQYSFCVGTNFKLSKQSVNMQFQWKFSALIPCVLGIVPGIFLCSHWVSSSLCLWPIYSRFRQLKSHLILINPWGARGHHAYNHPTTTQVLSSSRHSKRSTALWQNLLVRILSPLTLLIISFVSALCLAVPGMSRSSCQPYCSTRTLQWTLNGNISEAKIENSLHHIEIICRGYE